jgi:DNA invertase Pin-like site-specific DNA recombinase
MKVSKYNKITALYSRLSVGDEDRDGGESNSIQNQKAFLERYAQQHHLINIKHYIDDDESGRFFDRPAYSAMIDDVRNGKIGTIIIKDMTRWGRDYLEVGNAMELMRVHQVRFIAIISGIDSNEPSTLEYAPFINIMSEMYAKDISKKVKTGIKTKGLNGKPIVTEAPYGYIKDPSRKDFWLIDENAAGIVREIFNLFMAGKNRNQICVYLTENQILTPTFYLKGQDRGTAKNKPLNEAKRYKWNKASLTHILTRQEYCGDVVNFRTAKHYKDKHSRYVDKSEWHITENVHEPIIDRVVFENVQRILENAPVKRPNGDGYIHPLSGLLFCKDCGAKLHIRTIRRSENKYLARCSEYSKGKDSKCGSQHQIDCDILMQNIAELLNKIAKFSLDNRDKFEDLVKNSLAMQQTVDTKKKQKRIPQITNRLEQIDKVINKLYEDNALGNIDEDRYQQLSQKYSEEYYSLKKELEETQEQLSDQANASQRAKKFIKMVENYCAFDEVTPTAINEFISKLVVHERDVKGARIAVQHVEVHFNYIGTFENEITAVPVPTEEELERQREEQAQAKREYERAWRRNWHKEYRANNIEKLREYQRFKAREYRAKRKQQQFSGQPAEQPVV